MMMQQEERQGGYNFAAYPRVVGSKQKFKDPYSGKEMEGPPSNIMYDRRVIRGNTYATMVVPAVPTADKQRAASIIQQQPAESAKEPALAEEPLEEINAQEPGANQLDFGTQTEPPKEEVVEKQPQYDYEAQTDFFVDRPPTPKPPVEKVLVSTGTKIEGDELFKFDNEVEPVLGVLCNKLLEQSRMEVLEEEELRTVHGQQTHYKELKQAELLETKRLETEEQQRLAEIERRKVERRAVKEGQCKAHQKLIGRILAKEYLKFLRPNTLRLLISQGLFTQPFSHDLYVHVVPWMYNRTAKLMDDEVEVDNAFAGVMKTGFESALQEHKLALDKEHARRDAITDGRRRKAEDEARRREQRRKERAERRRLEELRKLQEKVKTTIVDKAVEKEEILKQEMMEVHGFYQGKETVGLIGGLLTEMAAAFTATGEVLEGKDFVTEKNAYVFAVMYIGQWMQQEAFPLFLGPKLIQFLAGKNVKPEEAHNMEPPVSQEFAELYKTYVDEDAILKLIKEKGAETGIQPNAIDFLRGALLKLLLRKPTDPDPQGRNMAAKQKLRPTTLPDGFDKNLLQPQAIIKMLIPKEPVGDEPSAEDSKQKSGDESRKKVSLNKSKKDVNTSKKSASRADNEEREFDNKVLTVKPVAEDVFVYVVHEAATKEVRTDLCEFVKKQFAKDLDTVDADAIKEKFNAIAAKLEAFFFDHFKEVPVFSF